MHGSAAAAQGVRPHSHRCVQHHSTACVRNITASTAAQAGAERPQGAARLSHMQLSGKTGNTVAVGVHEDFQRSERWQGHARAVALPAVAVLALALDPSSSASSVVCCSAFACGPDVSEELAVPDCLTVLLPPDVVSSVPSALAAESRSAVSPPSSYTVSPFLASTAHRRRLCSVLA
jgi:hypothetical protein